MTHVYSDAELGIFYVVDKRGRKIREKKVKKSKRSRPYWPDSIRDGVTSATPGSGRVDDLAAFYAKQTANDFSTDCEQSSPFTFE
jgi:hypothetical protein